MRDFKIQIPKNPIDAVTHQNPYSYYADLAAKRPIYFDETLNLWVASGSSAVTSVLDSELCRVRPVNEPVPNNLLGTAAGRIFRYLVRMNDGQTHCPLRKAISETIDAIDINLITKESEKWAERLFNDFLRAGNFSWITNLAFRLPIYTMAGLLGVPENKLGETEKLMSAFVRCLAPGSPSEQIEEGRQAAQRLYEMFEELALQDNETDHNILSQLNKSLRKVHIFDHEITIANSIGLLFQPYEATAGLIGNALLSLALYPQIFEQVKSAPQLLANFIEEVSRFDPSVQNTRRFVAENGQIAGENMKEGEMLLVVLAAANRDPEANLNPENFDIFRENRRSFTFGSGKHRCPGENIALKIAEIGVRKLIFSKVEINKIKNNIQYRSSANTRIPIF